MLTSFRTGTFVEVPTRVLSVRPSRDCNEIYKNANRRFAFPPGKPVTAAGTSANLRLKRTNKTAKSPKTRASDRAVIPAALFSWKSERPRIRPRRRDVYCLDRRRARVNGFTLPAQTETTVCHYTRTTRHIRRFSSV